MTYPYANIVMEKVRLQQFFPIEDLLDLRKRQTEKLREYNTAMKNYYDICANKKWWQLNPKKPTLDLPF